MWFGWVSNASLAMILITHGYDDSKTDLKQCAYLYHDVQVQAIKMELMDPREKAYVLTSEADFPYDLNLIQKRYADLKDAPPLYDCQRFPNRQLMSEALAFNRAYGQHIAQRQELELWNAYQLHLIEEENHVLYEIWDTARDSQCEYYYVSVRRLALKKLKEKLGDRAYYSGQLPPFVPVWRFQHIDP